MPDEARVSWPRAALSGGAGALLFGLLEVLDVGVNSRLAPDLGSLMALGALALAVHGPAGALIGSVGALKPARRWPELAFALGFTLPVAVRVAVMWSSDPPPQADHWPLQGDALAALGLGLVPLGLGALWAWGASRSRIGAWAALGVGIMGALLARHPRTATVPAASHPNLLLVTLDTARYDRFGQGRVDTEAFDRIATAGVRYERAYAEIPVTGPSHLTILSGVPPWEHGVLLNGRRLPPERALLAERLHDEGYTTGAFVSAYVLEGELGYARGFDVYDDDFRFVTGLGHSTVGALLELLIRHRDGDAYLLERRGDLTVDKALVWLAARDRDRPFFLWVHLFDPHGAYVPPPPFDERFYDGDDPRDPANRSMRAITDLPPYLAPSLVGITDAAWVTAQYDGEIAFTDQQLGRLLDALDRDGTAANTLVVAVGDHGEGLGEEGEWFAHGDHLYEHDLHVPLAIRLPTATDAGTVVDEPVALSGLSGELLARLGLGGAAFEPGRARAVCLDREANREARTTDPRARPFLRKGSVFDGDEQVLAREAAPDALRYWRGGVEVPFATDDPEAARWRAQLARDATSVLGGRAPPAPVDDATRALLEQLGYIEP